MVNEFDIFIIQNYLEYYFIFVNTSSTPFNMHFVCIKIYGYIYKKANYSQNELHLDN